MAMVAAKVAARLKNKLVNASLLGEYGEEGLGGEKFDTDDLKLSKRKLLEEHPVNVK